MTVDYKALQENVKALNESCGTTIKIISIKKKVLEKDFSDAMESGLDGIPESVAKFYADNFTLAGASAEKLLDKVKDAQPVTCYDNTMETLVAHANTLGIAIEDGTTLETLEKNILDTLDDLSEDAWGKLSDETRQWDVDMEKKVKAKKKADAAEKAKTKKKEPKVENDKDKDSGEDKEPKKTKEHGSRPDFVFSEGTNARQVIDTLNGMYAKAGDEGIKLKDLQDACIAAGLKSSNVKGRVSTVIRYAMTEEGGSQVTKRDDLLYPKA